jgi:hypothetical protein
MKPSANIFGNMAAALLLVVTAGLSPQATAQVVTSAGTNMALRSVFILPANPKEGRDPFFPNSLRPYQGRPQPGGNMPVFSDLKLGGITTVGSRSFVIINDVTFGVGDDADVRTPKGSKIHILCLQIGADSAEVEVGSQTFQLKLPNP